MKSSNKFTRTIPNKRYLSQLKHETKFEADNLTQITPRYKSIEYWIFWSGQEQKKTKMQDKNNFHFLKEVI